MINLNSVCLVGRITKEIELRKTPKNTSVCQFTLAIKRQGDEADFINCVAWSQSAEFLSKYATKGTIASVEGRIQTRTYEGDKGKVYITEVIATNVQIISEKKTEKPIGKPVEQIMLNNGEKNMFGGDVVIDTEDLPFY